LLPCIDAQAETTSCDDKTILVTDETSEYEYPTQIAITLDCHEGNNIVPEMTTLHYISLRNNKFCHASRTCGNLSSWCGSIRIGFNWYFEKSLNTMFQNWGPSDETQYSNWSYSSGSSLGGDKFYLEFKINRKEIERYCSPTTEWECLSIP
jgi:hypothetical protein